MPSGPGTYRKRGRPKKETIVLKKSKGAKEDGKITFKEGTLRRQLKMKKGEKFSKSDMNKLKKIEVGKEFMFHDRKFKMTKLMKQRINLGATLMKM